MGATLKGDHPVIDKIPYPNPHNEPFRADRADRVRLLRNALGANPTPKLGAADQEAVSRDLHRLLQRVQEERGIAKSKILRQARIGDEDDSTKHLSQYATPPNRKPARLTKKVTAYANLARAAAKLAGLEEDDALLEVFGRASFWQSTITRQASPEFEELAARLRLVMDGIARKFDLTGLFVDVLKSGGVLDTRPDCFWRERDTSTLLTPQDIGLEFDFGGFGGPQAWPIEFYQPTTETETGTGDQIPVYPSLVLGAWWLDHPFPAAVGNEMTDARDLWFRGKIIPTFPVSVIAEVTDADGSTRTISGTVKGRHEVELRLCIVPVGKTLEATPALRVQLSSALSPLTSYSATPSFESETPATESVPCHTIPILTFPWEQMPPLRPGKSKVVGRSASGDRDVECEIDIKGDVMPRIIREYFDDANSVIGVRFLPITGAICEDWFSFTASQNHYDPMQRRLAQREQGSAIADLYLIRESPAAKFRFDTLADIIDRCLCDGVDGLDMRLQDRAELRKGLYDDALRVARRHREEGWSLVEKRWAPPSHASDD